MSTKNKIVGVSEEHLKKQVQADFVSELKNAYISFNDDLNKVIYGEDLNWFETALGWAGTLSYGLTKGMVGAVGSLVSTVQIIYGNALNTWQRTTGADSFGEGAREFFAGLGDIGLNAVQGLSEAGVSLVANVGGAFGADTTWAFGDPNASDFDMSKKGFVSSMNDTANNWRRKMYGEKDLDKIYLQDAKDQFDEAVDFKNYWDENIAEKTASFVSNVTTGFTGEKYREQIALENQDNAWYQLISGSAESIGNILASWGMAKMVSSIVPSSMFKGGIGAMDDLVNISSKAGELSASVFFASNIFSSGFAQVINNGGTYQEAYQYGMSSALIETLLENLGGITPSGTKESMGFIERLTTKLLGENGYKNFGSLLSSALEEGFEEVMGELTGTANERYLNDGVIELKTQKELWTSLGFAAMSGALSSALLGTGQSIYLNNTLESKTMNIAQDFSNIMDSKKQQQYIDKINNLVDYFNTGNVRGAIENGQIKKFNEQQKIDYLKKTGLDKIITYTKGLDGTYIYELKNGGKDIQNMFKNKVDGEIITNSEYAINNAVVGKEVDNRVLKQSEVDPALMERANTFNIPVAFVKGGKDTQAFVNNDGIIYVNSDVVSLDELDMKLISHEVAHLVMREDTSLVDNLMVEVFNVLKDENFDPEIRKNIESALTEIVGRKFDIKKDTSVENIANEIVNGKDGETDNLIKQEMVAYIIENFNDKQLERILTNGKDKNLLQRISDKFNNKNSIKELSNNKKTTRNLNKLRRKFNSAVNLMVRRQTKIDYFSKHVFGKNYKSMFKEQFADLTEEEYEEAIASIEMKDNIVYITIKGETLKLKDVVSEALYEKFRTEDNLEEFKQFEEESKRIVRPKKSDYERNFEFNKKDIEIYLSALRPLAPKTLELAKSDTEVDIFNVYNKLVLGKYDDLTDVDNYLIARLSINQRFAKAMENYDKLTSTDSSTIIGKAGELLVRSVTRFFKEKTPFKNVSDKHFSKIYESSSVIEVDLTSSANQKAEFDSLIKDIIPSLLTLNERTDGKYNVEGTLTDGIAEIRVIPTFEALEKEAERLAIVRQNLTIDKEYQTKDIIKMQLDVLRERDLLPNFERMQFSPDKDATLETMNDLMLEGKNISVVMTNNLINNYNFQSMLNKGYKLIETEFFGYTRINGRLEKISNQLWVNKTDLLFSDYPDLRTINRFAVHEDFMIDSYQAKKSTFDKKKQIDFDFAVFSRGENYDYNDLIYSNDELDPKYMYVFVKANNKEVLKRLESIDYNELGEKGSWNYNKGFSTSDLVYRYREEFEEDKSESKRVDSKQVIELFGEEIGKSLLDNFMELNEDGTYTLVNKTPIAKKTRRKTKMIDGNNFKTIDPDIHAVSFNQVMDGKYIRPDYRLNQFGDVSKRDRIVKISELSESQLLVFEILKNTNLNFAIVKHNASSKNIGGYSFQQTTFFLNVDFLTAPGYVYEVLIHEHFHDIFNKMRINRWSDEGKRFHQFLKDISKTFFNEDGTYSDLFNIFDSQYAGDNGFEKYFNKYYSTRESLNGKEAKFKLNNKTMKDIFNYVIEQDHRITAENFETPSSIENFNGQDIFGFVNEVLAQYIGKIFSNKEMIESIMLNEKDLSAARGLKSIFDVFDKENSDKVNFLQEQYYRIMEDYKDALDKSYGSLIEVIDGRLDQVKLNEFVNKFTNGEFATRDELIKAWGDDNPKAQTTLDNVIYFASIMEDVINKTLNNKKALNSEEVKTLEKELKKYKTLYNEFDKYKQIVENLVISRETAIFLKENSPKDIVEDLINLSSELLINEDANIGYIEDQIYEKLEKAQRLLATISPEVWELLGVDYHEEFSKEIETIINGIEMGEDMKDLITNSKLVDYNFEDYNLENDSLINAVIKVQGNIHNKLIDQIISEINAKVNSALRSLNNVSKQAVSGYSQDIKNVVGVIQELGKNVLENKKDMGKMKKTVIETLSKLVKTIYETDKYNEAVVLLEDGTFDSTLGNYELIELFNNLLYDVHYEMASFFQDKNILAKIISAEEMKLTLQAIDIEDFNNSFNPIRLGNALKNLIIAVQTVYTTSLDSKDEMTQNEYAIEKIKQLQEIKKQRDGKQFSPFPFTPVATPQDFLQSHSQVIGEDTFFGDLFREYMKASERRDKIYADFHRRDTEFYKKNKNALKNSTTKIDVDTSYIIEQRNEDRKNLEGEVKRMREPILERIKFLKESINSLREENKNHRARLKDLKAEYEDPSNKNNKNILKQIREQQKEYRALVKHNLLAIQRFNNEVKQKKTQLETNNINFEIRKNIAEKRENGSIDKYVSLSRGEIVSIYLSLLREISNEDPSNVNGVPTRHLNFGNTLNIVDLVKLSSDGIRSAKENVRQYLILANDKKAFANYLYSLMNEQDIIAMNYAREVFDDNYKLINYVYEGRFGVSLPKEKVYIPFSTNTSNQERDFNLRTKAVFNIGTSDGMTKLTSRGASNPLMMDNIFQTIVKNVDVTANYSYERVITDYQNFLVNGSAGVSLQDMMTGTGNMFGDDNRFIQSVETFFANILGFGDHQQNIATKFVLGALRNTGQAIIVLNFASMLKQYASIPVVFFKTMKNTEASKFSLATMFIDAFKNTFYNTENRQWLLDNNANFYNRVMSGGMPNVSRQVDATLSLSARKKVNKVVDFLSTPSSRADGAVILSAFDTLVRVEKKKDPSISQNEARERANKIIQKVLIFDVANTSTPYRTILTNDKNVISRIVTRFQSESMMHTSAIIKNYYKLKNGKKNWGDLFDDAIALLTSSLMVAVVQTAFNEARGYGAKEGDKAFEFWINEYLWGNLIGTIPIINQVTNMVEWDKKKILNFTFDVEMPGFSQISGMIEAVINIMNGNQVGKNFTKAIETFGAMFGIPLRNINRILKTTSRLIGNTGNKTAIEMNMFLNSSNGNATLSKAIKEGNGKVIKTLLKDIYTNNRVIEEVTSLLEKDDVKISFYNNMTFKSKGETYQIDPIQREKYTKMIERTLSRLFNQFGYKKLKEPKDKAKAIQKVINYYWNSLKKVTLKEKFELLPIQEILNRALK